MHTNIHIYYSGGQNFPCKLKTLLSILASRYTKTMKMQAKTDFWIRRYKWRPWKVHVCQGNTRVNSKMKFWMKTIHLLLPWHSNKIICFKKFFGGDFCYVIQPCTPPVNQNTPNLGRKDKCWTTLLSSLESVFANYWWYSHVISIQYYCFCAHSHMYIISMILHCT